MNKLAIFATIEVQPGTRDAAVKVLLGHRARCLRDEPGTIQFDVLVVHGARSGGWGWNRSRWDCAAGRRR